MHKCKQCPAKFDTTQKLGVHKWSAHTRQRVLKPIEHGTVAGYQAHKRRDTAPCAKCRNAWRDYYQKKRLSSDG